MDYKALYEAQLEENKKLKQFKQDVIDATQYDDDLEDEEYIDYIKEMEHNYDPELDEEKEKEIKELKEENKKLKKTITNLKKMRKIQEEAYDKLEEEEEKLKKMIDGLPNDMEDKWWCEKIERWRWDGDGFDEEEESEEESDEEVMTPEEFMNDWLETNLTEDMVGSESIYIMGYGEHEFLQDDFENDMVAYCFNNYSEMSDELKQKWEEQLAFDDGEASHHEDVGVLAEHIEEYFLNVLKVPKSKMQEWSEFWDKKREEEEDEDQYKNYGVMLVSHETNDEDDIGYYDTLEEAQSAFKETIKKFADCRVVIFDTEDYNPFEDNIGTIHIIEDYNNQ